MPRSVRKRSRIDVASIRREQIVEAAVAAIAERGLENLSLSEIETRAGMSRGQLTYYFKTKEAILLAVFDHVLAGMCRQRGMETDGDPRKWLPGWDEMVRGILAAILERPAPQPEFASLHHTFLAQIGHRADFRRRLASLYEEWRSQLAEQLTKELRRHPPTRPVSARDLASIVQAIFHGMAVQAAAYPDAVRSDRVVNLCLDLLNNYLWNRRVPMNGPARQTLRRANTHNGRRAVGRSQN